MQDLSIKMFTNCVSKGPFCSHMCWLQDIDDLEELEREVLSGRWEKEMRKVREMERDRRRDNKKGIDDSKAQRN